MGATWHLRLYLIRFGPSLKFITNHLLHANRTSLCAPSAAATNAASVAGTRHVHCARGIDHLREAGLNKGLAFTLEERQQLCIHGLLPARFKTLEEQLEVCKLALNQYEHPLNKYVYLSDLHDRNERLYFRLLTDNIHELMPIVYTPTVGLACQRFGLIHRKPHGLFITINDRGYIANVVKNWPEQDVRAICVTDGERILGLGDLGAHGMGICVGKLALYTALAGIKPHQCLPIMVDVGTNNIDLLQDPLYVGLRQKRVSGREYEEFMDEFMQAIVRQYGPNTLIQFEDFGNHNAFLFLEKYRNTYCTFNDDIQGTASVAVAGLYASTRITKKTLADYKYVFAGAGEAALGIADLCVKAMVDEGLPQQEAENRIWMVDIEGLITKNRKPETLSTLQRSFAKDHAPEKSLEKVVAEVKPSVLIGATAAAGLFTENILRSMGANTERPVIYALSNPTEKAECTAEQAFNATEGRVVFSSGSPFPPVNYNGKVYTPGQGNNAYVFPGLALGVICTGAHHIPDQMFLIAAKELAATVDEADLERGSLYPPLTSIREVSLRIAVRVTECAYNTGVASRYPEPQDKRKWIEAQLYKFKYESSLPVTWAWPRMPYFKTREMTPTVLLADSKTKKK